MLMYEAKKKEGKKCFITVKVGGSTMSYKLVVKKEEKVEALINKVLRSYHREGRLPKLGLHPTNFMLFPRNGIQVPRASEEIGVVFSRSFVLMSKKLEDVETIPINYEKLPTMRWKAWVRNYLNRQILNAIE